MKSKFYVNKTTGEVSESSADAALWHRAGNQVEVWRNGRIVLVFNDLGL